MGRERLTSCALHLAMDGYPLLLFVLLLQQFGVCLYHSNVIVFFSDGWKGLCHRTHLPNSRRSFVEIQVFSLTRSRFVFQFNSMYISIQFRYSLASEWRLVASCSHRCCCRLSCQFNGIKTTKERLRRAHIEMRSSVTQRRYTTKCQTEFYLECSARTHAAARSWTLLDE